MRPPLNGVDGPFIDAELQSSTHRADSCAMEAIVGAIVLIWVTVSMVRWATISALKQDVSALKKQVALLEAERVPRPAAAATPPPAPVPRPAAPVPPAPKAHPAPVPLATWAAGASRPAAASPPVVPAPAPSTPKAAPRPPRADWERWIGTHLLAIAGAAFVLLGAVFFVTVAISNGWLTPVRQVILAVTGGSALALLALRLHDPRERARDLLGQSLAAAGSGVVVLGLVAGARLYDEQVVPTWLALAGTGIAGGYMVFCAWRWRAQATAALGITTALIAPPLVGAAPNLASAAFVAVALAVAGLVTVRCAWPWLAHAGLWLTVWQLGIWLFDQRPAFVHETASTSLAIGVIAALAGWWLLVTAPALITERRHGWRVPPASVVISASAAATLIGSAVLAADEHPGSWPVQALGLTLVALHLAAAVALWRSARPAALLVLALGGAITALTASTIFGEAGQVVFWSIEAAALIGLSRRQRDLQTLIVGTAAYVAATVQFLVMIPPGVLLHGAGGTGRMLLAGLALTAALLAGSRIGRRPRPAWPWLAGAVGSAAWTIQALAVSLVAPLPGTDLTDQTAQIAATGALIALALVVVLVFGLAASRGPRHGVAFALAGLLALKAVVLDLLVLGTGTTAVAIGFPLLVAGLAVVGLAGGRGAETTGKRTLLEELERPSAMLPPVAVAGIALAVDVTPDALAVGTSHLAASLGLWIALVVALVATTAQPGRGRRVPVRSLAAWRSGRCAIWPVGAARHRRGVLGRHRAHAPDARRRQPSRRPAGAGGRNRAAGRLVDGRRGARPVGRGGRAATFAPWVLGVLVSGKAVLIDCIGLGVHGSSLVLSAAALVVAAAWPLRRVVARMPEEGPAGLPAIVALAVGGIAVAGPMAIVEGSTDAFRGTIALAIAALLAIATALRHDAPAAGRHALVTGAITVGLLAESIAVVTLLTPAIGTVDRGAQLGLSIVWAATAIALIAIGLVWRGDLASAARRTGIPLLGVAVAKVLVYDTARLSLGQRAGLFLAIGGLLLVGAFLYTRLLGLTRGDAGDAQPSVATGD